MAESPDIYTELLEQKFGLEEAVMTTQQIDLAVFPEMEEADTELVPCDDLRSEIISVDPERMWGTPCFVGTRLPVKSLFDHLASGVSLEEFLDQFEGMSREVCAQTLEMAFQRLMEGLPDGRAHKL
jgi:uncharacterized protein (DUF433 family)